jgi:ankyrin repeat protein
VNVREASGLTPLHCAATGDSESTVRLLFEKGADPKLKDGFGATPERTAILNKKEKLATLIQQLTK